MKERNVHLNVGTNHWWKSGRDISTEKERGKDGRCGGSKKKEGIQPDQAVKTTLFPWSFAALLVKLKSCFPYSHSLRVSAWHKFRHLLLRTCVPLHAFHPFVFPSFHHYAVIFSSIQSTKLCMNVWILQRYWQSWPLISLSVHRYWYWPSQLHTSHTFKLH